jgi:acetyltransferase
VVAGGVRLRRRGVDLVDRRLVDARLATLADAPALARLHLEAIESGMALSAAPGAYAGTLERLHGDAIADPGRVVLVAEEEGRILAMAQLDPSKAGNASHRAEVQRVAVAASSRGKGVGRRLMEAVEVAARERGLTLVWLTTHNDSEACAFYESLGYTKLGVMPNYSRRPDGALWPGAFYFKDLSA